MLKLHTVYVITLVSQTTSALVLLLLSWVDRRSRWLVPLAASCGLHAAAIYLMPLWRGTGRWLPQAISAALLVAMLYLIHMGLQRLIWPLKRRSAKVEAGSGGLMALLFALGFLRSLWCTEATCLAGALLLARTSWMLWTAPKPALRGPLRGTALLLLAISAHFLVRLPLELTQPASAVLLALRESTMLLVTLMAFSFLAIYATESRRRLHEESRLDLLTGLFNRRAMEENAAQQLLVAARNRWPCALLMIDLDHFKELNDTWGHDLGDRALMAAGGLLRRTAQETRQCDAARMGGEEFAMLLADWSVDAAYALAERLVSEMAALRVGAGGAEVGFTASVGVSVLQAGETIWTNMLRRADVAMYRAKEEGRNRVVVCSEALLTSLDEATVTASLARRG
ncbi:MAG TPA: GGDEF domain-containing protein [Acidobacteriaceae bacterium]|nr:GGDEF domain-containing protein [Acidobacteriaceae bacterium]